MLEIALVLVAQSLVIRKAKKIAITNYNGALIIIMQCYFLKVPWILDRKF